MLQGTRARISVWGIPNVNYNSESAVFIAVWNENNGNYYSMVAGFHTANDTTVCYSTICQGFVVSNVSGAPVPGGKVAPLSTFNGKDYFVTLSIKKDEKTQDWSLYRDDNNNPILIGWWPKALFNKTFDYATKIIWAGGVMYHQNETSPSMGSGHIGCEGANKAAYISNIKIFNELGQIADPYVINDITDRYDCFTTSGVKYSSGKAYNFFYGGPAVCNN
ncbi:hypothetical protein FCM35_KLT15479 [Carex littledalei]|uniref:Neprosin PEP catalytic domain-containing protein n=1 Tax=Carex littledalei TaxID=544730 RepID=A0A833RH24_9POAL|nr:hypothetical protein FCM35_KLT15479 [Carex littledalei]